MAQFFSSARTSILGIPAPACLAKPVRARDWAPRSTAHSQQARDAEILGAFQDRLLPAAHDFQPDLVLVSAGFDSLLGDPLGRFTLSDADFADLTTLMLEIADTYAGGRLVSVLEGGYSLEGLASAAVAHVNALVLHAAA
jgi:acetoin utilization deacetylase AcuC-like enzyme